MVLFYIMDNIETTSENKDKLGILQTWKNLEIPVTLYNLIKKVQEKNPDAHYRFFTDETIISFIQLYCQEYYKPFTE